MRGFTEVIFLKNTYTPHFYPATIALASVILSIVSPAYAAETWVVEERDTIITAYYSPEPNQRKYFLGSLEADVTFNGQGVQGADGTRVYPGMIAAPAALPFGTRIEIPGLSIVGTVHDRGGRIVEGSNGTIRIDLWMGKGEEGLARALHFGVQEHRATLYVPKSMDVPKEKFDLLAFPSPQTVLTKLPSEAQSLVIERRSPSYGDTSLIVTAVQNALKNFEYFDHVITTYYGDVTKDAVENFQRDAGIKGTGETADERTRQTLAAHTELTGKLEEPELEEETLMQGSNGRAVRVLQRLLSLLSLYQGEIDGEYDQKLMSTIYQFQKEKGIVISPADTGAGIVGPATRRALLTAWRQYRIDKKGGVETVVSTLSTNQGW